MGRDGARSANAPTDVGAGPCGQRHRVSARRSGNSGSRHWGHPGSVASIDKVADAIEAGQDELSGWARNHGQALFRRTPPALAPQFTRAHALAGNPVVMTYEGVCPEVETR